MPERAEASTHGLRKLPGLQKFTIPNGAPGFYTDTVVAVPAAFGAIKAWACRMLERGANEPKRTQLRPGGVLSYLCGMGISCPSLWGGHSYESVVTLRCRFDYRQFVDCASQCRTRQCDWQRPLGRMLLGSWLEFFVNLQKPGELQILRRVQGGGG
jgi:hypothetical protein